MSLEIEPLTPHFAARVSGFSIRDGVDAETFAAIEAAFEEHSVLLFPDQPVTDEEQIAFSERFGELEGTLKGAVGADSKLARITNILPDGSLKDPDSQLALFTRANMFWHADSTFKATPAKASLLSARIVPPEGGDTEFASTRAAWQALPERTRAEIENLVAVHDLAYSREKLAPGAISDEQRAALPPVQQALVRTNPVNGRKALLLGAHVSGIVGMNDMLGRALHDTLMEFATQPEATWRHSWRADDIVMWDNRCVLHRGHLYDERNHRRLMIRTTVAGAGPTAADGQVLPAAAA